VEVGGRLIGIAVPPVFRVRLKVAEIHHSFSQREKIIQLGVAAIPRILVRVTRRRTAGLARPSTAKEYASRCFSLASKIRHSFGGGGRERVNSGPSYAKTKLCICRTIMHKTSHAPWLFPRPEGDGQGEGEPCSL
jgi:hypothetical protein